ncbi:WD repeat-containing protein 78 [Cichlidogyrus casuarinus]|uniref:Dynein axonemal intermediate chain 4 n=1 Tax=Cichlidogyrus casuarinus TaxID=1844966 RepID=A0ABD2QJ10_9PLAT
MERALNLNTLHDRLKVARAMQLGHPEYPLVFRNEDLLSSKNDIVSVQHLWQFSNSHLMDRNVTCLEFNPKNPDLFAVGYGQFEFTSQKNSYACCWSMKNANFPERLYMFNTGVTCLAWSETHPNILAIGLFNGNIQFFDVRSQSSKPVLDTINVKGRHFSTVRAMEFVNIELGTDMHSHSLVSLGHDGRVLEWDLKRSNDFSGASADDFTKELLKLKRTPNAITQLTTDVRAKLKEFVISRLAIGTCMRFHPEDQNLYIVGTGDGNIYKCSMSYRDQYLMDYKGHTLDVYQLEWSPFSSDYFVSASADWTIKIWHIDKPAALVSIQSNVVSI